MSIQASYLQASERLNDYLDEAAHNREIVIIHRPGEEDVALIAADELAGLLETAHLLRSPANADRLLTALKRVRSGQGSPQSLDELRQAVGLDEITPK